LARILIIEDEPSIRLSLKAFFESKDYEVYVAETGSDGLDAMGRYMPDIVLLDLRLPDLYGLNIIKELKSINPDSVIFIMTAFGEINEAIEAIKAGAENYFQKPIDLEELGAIVDKSTELVKIRGELALSKKTSYPIIGKSRAMQGLFHLINLLASNPSTTVLIYGETGTGKELVARNIHALSQRARYPFVDINCASIPEHILESELFGFESGAFTDAKTAKKGLFEIADKGTLFLDEIGDMPLQTQAKILRVLETRSFRRLGGIKDIKVDIRFIAATNKDLQVAVKDGSFREDLYYRLNVMPVNIPPLRERTEDIRMLAEFFLHELSIGKRLKGFSEGALRALESYNWPGNVRELKNIVERAVILSTGPLIEEKDLRIICTAPSGQRPQTIEDVIKAHIISTLRSTGGNRTKAAKMLGISRSTLIEKLKSYNIDN